MMSILIAKESRLNKMKLRSGIFLMIFLVVIKLFPQVDNSAFSLRGYIKEMPAVQFERDFSEPQFVNLVHNRLNFRWDINTRFHFVAEGRNRLFFNEMFRDSSGYITILETDPGLMDLSWVWMGDGNWIGHSNLDRLFLDWRRNNWQVRVGRQRINWGLNLVSNPNDLFNTYSFFDFDYVERPGADAVRIQYHTGFASRLEVAYSPSKYLRESTGALLWSVNHRGYDLQVIAGYYRNRSALGAGWAGSIGGAGFKGEVTWFYHLVETTDIDRGNVVAATGVDYMFGTGTFAVLEFLFNGGYVPYTGEDEIVLPTQPLRPDNIMFSEYATTLSLQQPFSSVFQGSLAVMVLPDIELVFIMPGFTYSLLTNFDLEFVSQIFTGGNNSILDEAGSSWFFALQYNF
jgi:hypothetical protein